MKVAAFFDMDKTLITKNGAKTWMMREYRLGHLGVGHLVRGTFHLLLNHFGIVNIEHAMRQAISTLKGLTEEEVIRATEEWFAEDMVPHAAPGAQAAVDGHKKQGHLTVLHTSSSPYASKCAVEHFGLDDFLCSTFEVVDGKLTGDFVPPLCYGEGKVGYAKEYAEREQIDLSASYFYTDSFTDLPMLLAVGHPMIVQPDPRLKREAERRGWPIVDWT